MASYGNTSVSALLSAAQSAQSKAQAANDSLQAYNWNLSDKSQQAYDSYANYLNTAASKTSDQSKQLSYASTLVAARRTSTSSQISQLSTQIKYGEGDDASKMQALNAFRNAALQNGDNSLAQSLEGQMATLDISMQNKAQAAADRAQSASDRAARESSAATTKGYTRAIAEIKGGIKELNAGKLAGQILPSEYKDRMIQLQQGLTSILQGAQEATGDPNGSYQSQLDTQNADKTVQGLLSGYADAQNQIGDAPSQTIARNQDGTYNFKSRTPKGTQVIMGEDGKPVMDAFGHAMVMPYYSDPTATVGKEGMTGFEYQTNIIDGKIAPGTGRGGIRELQKWEINNFNPDGSKAKVPYFFTEAGQKKFAGVNKETGRPIMANNEDVITFDPSKRNIPAEYLGYAVEGTSDWIKSTSVGKGLGSIGRKIGDPMSIVSAGRDIASGRSSAMPSSLGPNAGFGGVLMNILNGSARHKAEMDRQEAALKAAQSAQAQLVSAQEAQRIAQNAAYAQANPAQRAFGTVPTPTAPPKMLSKPISYAPVGTNRIPASLGALNGGNSSPDSIRAKTINSINKLIGFN
jgi:hypothetical protein